MFSIDTEITLDHLGKNNPPRKKVTKYKIFGLVYLTITLLGFGDNGKPL